MVAGMLCKIELICAFLSIEGVKDMKNTLAGKMKILRLKVLLKARRKRCLPGCKSVSQD